MTIVQQLSARAMADALYAANRVLLQAAMASGAPLDAEVHHSLAIMVGHGAREFCEDEIAFVQQLKQSCEQSHPTRGLVG
jgi:hypothetical protein